MPREIVVTGGLGFIGSALIRRLVAKDGVTVIDNARRRSPQFDAVASHPNVTVDLVDITDANAVAKAIGTPDVVVHMAAIAGVSSYYQMPLRTMEVNLLGTRNVLEAAWKANPSLSRFVYFSTSEIFGPHAWRAREDGMTAQGDIADRRWTYSISKLAGEKLAYAYHWQHGLPIVGLRPFNVYGEGQIGEGALQIFTRRALANEPISVTGDGSQIRSWCHVDDMVDATLAAMEKPAAVGRSYNVGNPAATATILQLAERVRDIVGSRSPIQFVPHQGTDVDLRVPDIGRARAELEFEPRVPLEAGLQRTIRWYRETGALGEDPQRGRSA